MPYTSEKPQLAPTSDELRASIPGWGADIDPRHRPAVPMHLDPSSPSARWDFPERQEEKAPRERSIEHEILPPVFGTSVPLKGLSGFARRLAYRKFSEARAAHWLILIAADRIDAVESHLRSLLTLRPDNLVTETGILSEFSHHGFSSRFGKKRADLSHTWMDPLIVAAPTLFTVAAIARGARTLRRNRRLRSLR